MALLQIGVNLKFPGQSKHPQMLQSFRDHFRVAKDASVNLPRSQQICFLNHRSRTQGVLQYCVYCITCSFQEICKKWKLKLSLLLQRVGYQRLLPTRRLCPSRPPWHFQSFQLKTSRAQFPRTKLCRPSPPLKGGEGQNGRASFKKKRQAEIQFSGAHSIIDGLWSAFPSWSKPYDMATNRRSDELRENQRCLGLRTLRNSSLPPGAASLGTCEIQLGY